MQITVNMERVVRPFEALVALRRESMLQALLANRLPPDEDAEANLRWGAKSRFDFADAPQVPRLSLDQPDPIRGDGDTAEDDPDPNPLALTFNETSRTTSKVRVENPDDSDQYVMVERIETITFVGPDGISRKFVLNNPD